MSTNDAESPGEEGILRFWTFVIVLQVGIFIREKLSLSSLYQFFNTVRVNHSKCSISSYVI